MKIECVKDKLVEAITKAERFTGKHLSLPVLSHIYISADKNVLTIRATNLDCGIETTLPAKVIKQGEVVVSGSVLLSFLSNTHKDKTITVEVKEGTLVVSSGSTNSSLKTHPTEDFPTIPRVDSEKNITIDPNLLVKGLKSVWYSASTSSVKPELSSVYVYKDNQDLVFVSTDSFRLAEKRMRVKESTAFHPVIIPSKNIPDIIRTLESVKGDIHIHFDTNQIGVEGKDVYVMSRVVDATFPDYQQIIPKTFVSEVIALKQDIVDALKTAHTFADKFNQLTISVNPTNKKFELSTKNTDIGEFHGAIDATVSGQDLTINFNHRYVSDCLQSIEADSITLSLSGQNKPMVIKGVSDKTFTYLVMPMNR